MYYKGILTAKRKSIEYISTCASCIVHENIMRNKKRNGKAKTDITLYLTGLDVHFKVHLIVSINYNTFYDE